MSVELGGKGHKDKTKKVPKKNIMELSRDALKGDVDFALYMGETELPMELYTTLLDHGIQEAMADLIITHVDAEVRRAIRELRYSIAKDIEGSVVSAISDFYGNQFVEEVEVDMSKQMKDLMG